MSPTTPVLRRRRWGRLSVIAAGAAVVTAAATVRQAYAQLPTGTAEELADTVPHNDTSSVHRALRKRIGNFEDAWRKVWQPAQDARRVLEFRQSTGASIHSASFRRNYELACYTVPIQQLRRWDAFSPDIMHPIVTSPDRGIVCPNWLPPRNNMPPDEGEAIDLAIPPDSRDSVRAKRDSLLAYLAVAQKSRPFDTWITGQRVRFAYDQRDPERTVAIARSCRGDDIRCSALLGLALEQAGNLVAAESAFRRVQSLELKPAATDRKACLDPDDLLPFAREQRLRVQNEECARQQQLIDDMWWLADPLWSVPGNERFVAHQSRRIHATLRSVNNRDERYVWYKYAAGVALREMVVRYGWPSYTFWPGLRNQNFVAATIMRGPTLRFEMAPGNASYSGWVAHSPNEGMNPMRLLWLPLTTKEYSLDRTALLPSFSTILDPMSVTDEAWTLNNPKPDYPDAWWPQEHMQLRIRIDQLRSGQDVMWRRDTVIAYQLAIDDPLSGSAGISSLASAKLMGGQSAATTREIASSAVGDGFTLRFKGELPSKPTLLGAEILPRVDHEAARRTRYAVQPPPTLREMNVSDVALSEPVFLRLPNRTMEVPVDEAGVLRYMAGGLSFSKAEPLAVYWESYGFVPGDTVQIELRIRRDDQINVARRIGSLIGVASGLRDSISIRWTEPDGRHTSEVLNASKPIIGRSLGLDLNALPAGGYVVMVEMRKAANVFARSERRIVITDP